MVARRFDTKTASPDAPGFFRQLFTLWREFVTWCADGLADFTERLTPAENPDSAQRPWLLRYTVVWLGWAALVLGAAVGVALAPAGLARTLALWAGAQSVLWAGVRWLLMRLTGRGAARDSAKLRGATSLGLLAYVAAVTPELSVAAWVVSAVVTWLALVRLGDARRQAARTVGIAWGAQALVVAASWIARSGVMAFLARRG